MSRGGFSADKHKSPDGGRQKDRRQGVQGIDKKRRKRFAPGRGNGSQCAPAEDHRSHPGQKEGGPEPADFLP